MTQNSCLKIKLKKIVSSVINPTSNYKCFITVNTKNQHLTQKIQCHAFEKEILMDKSLSFALSKPEKKKDSICTIEITEDNQLFGKLSFSIIDYAYYFKTKFTLQQSKDPNAKLYMNTNICFSGEGQTKLINLTSPPTQLKLLVSASPSTMPDMSMKRDNMQNKHLFASVAKASGSNSLKSSQQIQSAIKPTPYMSTRPIKKKSSTKQKELNFSVKNPFTIKQSLQKPSTQKTPGTFQSCRIGSIKSSNDSHYCKDIQQNLTNLAMVRKEQNQLSISRGSKKQQKQISLFNTLIRMKDKFQQIHNDEEILNFKEEEDQYSMEDSVQLQDSVEFNPHKMETLVQIPENETSLKSNQTSLHNVSTNHFKNGKFLHYYRSVNVFVPPQKLTTKKILKLERTTNFQYITIQNPRQLFHQQQKSGFPKTRFKHLMNTHNKSDLNQSKNDSNTSIQQQQQQQQPTQVKKQPMQQIIYVKLNSFNYLTKAETTIKLRNAFLMQAHEEMLTAQRKLEEKLQISKKIIAQKQHMLTDQFEKLKLEITQVTIKLSQKSQQAKARQIKIKNFQDQIEYLTRENNKLKAQINTKILFLRDIKYGMANDEQKLMQQTTQNNILSSNELFTPQKTITPINSNDKKKSLRIFSLQPTKWDKRITFEMKMKTERKTPNSNWASRSFDVNNMKFFGNKSFLHDRNMTQMQQFSYEEKKLSTGEIFIDKMQPIPAVKQKRLRRATLQVKE